MSNRNSDVLNPIRPDDLQQELSIGRDAYYEDLKFLGIKAEKDSTGKAYLSDEQANLVRALRSHIKNTGKRDGFDVNNGNSLSEENSIVQAQGSDLGQPLQEVSAQQNPTADFDLKVLLSEAAELKGQQLAMADLVKLKLASQMTYEDLPETVRDKVDQLREAANPKFQVDRIAADLLQQWRQQRQQQQEAAAAA